MKAKYKLLTIILFGTFMSAQAISQEDTLKIRSLFNIKEAFCSIRTNDIQGLNNRNSAYSGRGGGISSTNSLLFMENGNNKVSIEIGALGWFSSEDIDDGQRAKFSPHSACKLDLVLFQGNSKKTLTSIQVNINPKGVPEAVQDQPENLLSELIISEQVKPGHINSEYYDAAYFPKNMKLYKFTKTVEITGIPEWQWVNANHFTGKDEQIHSLRKSYVEMASIINSRNRDALKKFDHIALKAWSISTGETEDSILESQYSKDKLEGGKAVIEKIDWDNYDIRVMSNGRIVQYYNKSNPIFSPLTYHFVDENGDDSLGSFAPMFSLINGKFVPVI